MSERGVFAVDRGLFDHPFFKSEPFTEREAFQWLIAEASFRDRTRRIGNVVVKLSRGQLAASLRFMAKKFDWNEPRVRRFLTRLKNDAMIDAQTDAGLTVITITNYKKYQRVSLPNDAETYEANDAAPTQHRRKREDTEYTEDKIDKIGEARGRSAFTEGSKELADAFLKAHGIETALQVPIEFASLDWRALQWEQAGYDAALIASCCAKLARDGPKSLNYYEKVFATAFAKQNAPLPKVEIVSPQTLRIVADDRQQAGNILQASDRLVDKIGSFDAGPDEDHEIRGRAGAAHVRLLSQG